MIILLQGLKISWYRLSVVSTAHTPRLDEALNGANHAKNKGSSQLKSLTTAPARLRFRFTP